jgi:drug/metabolite transporter (DMT)-like permease
LFLGERMGVVQIAGAIILMVGLAIVNGLGTRLAVSRFPK